MRGILRRAAALMLVLCLMAAACVCTGCKSTDVVESSDETEDHKIQIGMCFDSFVIERWEKDRDVFVSTARDLGAEVNVQNANGEIDKQIEQIDYFINKGVDAIVIVCIDGESLGDVVKRAKNKGIKVIAYDRMINNSDVDLYVSFDNKKVGTLMAEALVNDNNSTGKLLMLQGSPTDDNVEQVRNGFIEVLNGTSNEVVGSMYAEGWRAEDTSDYLYENPEILDGVGGIMCGNDNLATVVVRVLSEKRLAGTISVVGQDADLEACQRIVEGTQIMTVYKPVEKLASTTARAVVSLINGIEPADATLMSDGTYDVRSIVLEPIAVTKDNIDEMIIDSGFHLREEVYMNVIDQ